MTLGTGAQSRSASQPESRLPCYYWSLVEWRVSRIDAQTSDIRCRALMASSGASPVRNRNARVFTSISRSAGTVALMVKLPRLMLWYLGVTPFQEGGEIGQILTDVFKRKIINVYTLNMKGNNSRLWSV